MVSVEDVRNVLSKINDPEIQMDLVTLGLIYNVTVIENKVQIKMTFTTPFCPYGPALVEEIKETVKKELPSIKEVEVEVVFDPPWQPPEQLKAMMGF